MNKMNDNSDSNSIGAHDDDDTMAGVYNAWSELICRNFENLIHLHQKQLHQQLRKKTKTAISFH